jgi:hypothetical protein
MTETRHARLNDISIDDSSFLVATMSQDTTAGYAVDFQHTRITRMKGAHPPAAQFAI